MPRLVWKTLHASELVEAHESNTLEQLLPKKPAVYLWRSPPCRSIILFVERRHLSRLGNGDRVDSRRPADSQAPLPLRLDRRAASRRRLVDR